MTPINFFDEAPGNCWLTIDAGQLAENIRTLQTLAGKPVLASVKSNGYGHGYEIAAKAFLKGGVHYLGVARLAEGLLLRRAGLTANVLIIGGILPEEMTEAASANLEFFVWRPDHIQTLREIGKAGPCVHIKVDTGMGRLGCLPENALQIATELKTIPGVEITGLATHFASADMAESGDTQKQIDTFDQVIAALAGAGIRPKLIHAANSAGALYFPKARYDMERFGIAAYGASPDSARKLPDGVKPALTWRARVIESKMLPAGHGISYGGTYRLSAPQRIGVLPVGYGDGFRRTLGNTVLIDGQERKILGRVCMDHCMVDLDGFGDITGNEAVIIGEQRGRIISADDIAKRWGTISYDVFTGLAARIPRRVV